MKRSQRKRPPPHRTPAGWGRRRRHAAWLVVLLSVIALAVFSPRGYSLWARQAAAGRLRIGAISEAQRRLRQAARIAPGDGNVDLMSAFCFRQLRQADRWKAALEAAEKKGAPQAQVERERELYRIQAGGWPDGAESRLASLAGEGVTAYDVPAAFVAGALASGRNGLAQQLLDAWNADCPDDAHVAHMRGKYWESLGNVQQARAEYEAAVSIEPRHEMARVSLARVFEESDQLPQAFRQYAALGAASPASEAAAVGAARVFRKTGDLDRAQAVLEPLAETGGPAMEIAADMGRIAMDRGDLRGAERWFQQAGLERTQDPNLLMSAVRLRGIQGQPAEAERLFQRIAALGDRVTRIRELRTRLAVDPGDADAAAEVEKLAGELREIASAKALPAAPAGNEELPPGRRLFVSHCAACHGLRGDGNGPAARHLFPRPRDLRWEPSRLVSTASGVPSLDDTIAMLRRGVPGTSMPSFGELDEPSLRLVAEETHRLRREGLRERLIEVLTRQGEEVVEDDVQESVGVLTSPGVPIVVPPIGSSSPPAVLRGREIYAQEGCAKCHGDDGAGAADQGWYDERGWPVRARDLVREPFKGGDDAAAVYLRIAAGMPGSPHPSSRGPSPQQTVDLVHFCLSLSRGPEPALTDHQRAALATGRAYLAAVREGEIKE